MCFFIYLLELKVDYLNWMTFPYTWDNFGLVVTGENIFTAFFWSESRRGLKISEKSERFRHFPAAWDKSYLNSNLGNDSVRIVLSLRTIRSGSYIWLLRNQKVELFEKNKETVALLEEVLLCWKWCVTEVGFQVWKVHVKPVTLCCLSVNHYLSSQPIHVCLPVFLRSGSLLLWSWTKSLKFQARPN